MGSALSIPLPSGLNKKSQVTVEILYSTISGSKGTGLQWLEKEYVALSLPSCLEFIYVSTGQTDPGQLVPISFQSVPTHLRADNGAITRQDIWHLDYAKAHLSFQTRLL